MVGGIPPRYVPSHDAIDGWTDRMTNTRMEKQSNVMTNNAILCIGMQGLMIMNKTAFKIWP